MLTLEDWAAIDFEMQENAWADWERNTAEYPDLAHLFHKPTGKRLTEAQHLERLKVQAAGSAYFSMRTVTTGARRKWKRGK